MGIFSFFSNLIKKKTISLPEKCKGDIVYFVPLKNNSIELGTEIKIDHGYCVVVAYHNKVLDILRDDEGQIKLEDVTLPRLFKEHHHMLVKKGIVTPKSLPADVYFVKCGGHNLNFKTYEKFVCKTSGGKMRMRIAGDFDFCIKDMRKFMGVFCSEFAIVRNKALGKDISIVVADEVSKILDKAELSFDILSTCKDKVQSLILSQLSKLCVKLGIEISAIRVGELIVPKREKKLHDLAVQRVQEDEFLSNVEQELNKAQNTPQKVFVTASNSEIVLDNVAELEKMDATNTGGMLTGKVDVSGGYRHLADGAGGSRVAMSNGNANNGLNVFGDLGGGENAHFSSFGQNFEGKGLFGQGNEQKEPELFEIEGKTACNAENCGQKCEKISEKCENEGKSVPVDKVDGLKEVQRDWTSKKCVKCDGEIVNGMSFCSKCGTQAGELTVCACCGAKNLAGSGFCMVCKSKL